MKLCVFSDIHGNGYAFKKAYDMILGEQADYNIFLGDLCGYYFSQDEVFEKMLSLPSFIGVLGNHDQAFLDIVNGDERLRADYLNQFGRSVECLLLKNNKDLIQWLSCLSAKHVIEELGVVCCHGSPWDLLEEYVYPTTAIERYLEQEYSIFLQGHTHYPMAKNIKDKLIVNPGSLGQPRDGFWPTFATIDTVTKKVFFRKVKYEKKFLEKQIEQNDPKNKYIREVLFR